LGILSSFPLKEECVQPVGPLLSFLAASALFFPFFHKQKPETGWTERSKWFREHLNVYRPFEPFSFPLSLMRAGSFFLAENFDMDCLP